MYKLSFILLFAGMAMSSCGTNNNGNQDSTPIEEATASFPIITDNGVQPFLLGVYAPDIVPQGEWYDNIEVDETFEVMYGMMCNVTTVSAEELKEMQDNDMINDILSHHYALVVKRGEESLMRLECDENKRISKIEVTSSQIKLSNGICIGMPVEEMEKKANIKLYRLGMTTTDIRLALEIQGLAGNIDIHLADNNGLIQKSLWEAGTIDNWVEINEECYEIPLKEDVGDSIVSIVVH